MSRLFYISRILPGYRESVIRHLGRRLNRTVYACHGTPPNDGQALASLLIQQSELPHIPVGNQWLLGQRLLYQDFRRVADEMRAGDVVLLEESPRTINLRAFIRSCRRKKVPVVLWGHFSSNNRPFSASSPSDRYRIALANLADACVVYTDALREMLTPYVPATRVFVANNTLDSDTLIGARQLLSSEGREVIRRNVGVPNGAVALAYVGRLIRNKGIKRFTTAARHISASRPVALLVVGDGPEADEIVQLEDETSITVVKIPGTTDVDVIAPMVYAADVMVQPGYAGLSINLGLLLGTPVVTIPPPGAYRFHSPEIAFLVPGLNGEIADDDSPEALARVILTVVDNRDGYAKGAQDYADKNLTTARMLDGLVAAIQYVERRDSALSAT